ncbi:MAG: ABC transporter ATP-binding protein [Phycisphaerae bacterium]|nr:ABC transporter ATP-binding protein [Phycisphaerae bacterium]
MSAASEDVVASNVRAAIRLRGVTKTFGKGEDAVPALRGADMDALYGQMTMLVGPSGCGKTTLLSIVAGLLHRDAGEMEVLGLDHALLSASQLTRWRSEHVGFIFQAFNLIPQLSIAENVAVPLVIRGEPRRRAIERAAELLRKVGLGGREKAKPNKLSGGQQQRVAIARSLVHEPHILVCDEPTSALDASTGKRVMELIANVSHGPDRAVIVVTHDDRIFSFADRIVHMDDGRVTNTEIRR